MAKKKSGKKQPPKSRVVSRSVRKKSPILLPVKILVTRGSAVSFDATLTEIPDGSGMNMPTYDVDATLVLDYDKAVEELDDMEPPKAVLSGGDEGFFTPIAGTNLKELEVHFTGITPKPTSIEAVFRFRSKPMSEKFDF